MKDEIIISISRQKLQNNCDLFCKRMNRKQYKNCKHTIKNMVKCWAFYRLDFQIIKTEDK